MPTIKNKQQTAEAYFITTWDEAIALQKNFRTVRKTAKELFNVDNVQIVFVNPWRGRELTEIWIVADLPFGEAGSVFTKAVTKWLSSVVKDFLKRHRAESKQKPVKTPNSSKQKDNHPSKRKLADN